MMKVLFKFILLFMSILFADDWNIQVTDAYPKIFKNLQKAQSEAYLRHLHSSLNSDFISIPRRCVFYPVYVFNSVRKGYFPIFEIPTFPYYNNFDDLTSHHILHQKYNFASFFYYSKYVLNKHSNKVYINKFSDKIFGWDNIDLAVLDNVKLKLTYIEKIVLYFSFWEDNKDNKLKQDVIGDNNDSCQYQELSNNINNFDLLSRNYGYKGGEYIVKEKKNHFSWPYICSKSLSPSGLYSSYAYCVLIEAPESDEKIQGYLKYGFIDSQEKLNFFDPGNYNFFLNLEKMLSVLSDIISVTILAINDHFDFEEFAYLKFTIFYFVFLFVSLRFLYQFFDKGESEYNGFRKYYILLFIYYIFLLNQDSDQDSDGLILYLYDLLNQIIWNIISFVLDFISTNFNDSDNLSIKVDEITTTEELKVVCLRKLHMLYWGASAFYTVIFIIGIAYLCFTSGFGISQVFNQKDPINWIIMAQFYSTLGLVLMTLLDYYFYIYYAFLFYILILLTPIVIAFDNLPYFNNILRRWFVLVLENIFLFIVFVIVYYAILIFAYLLMSDNLLYFLLSIDLFSDGSKVDLTGVFSQLFDQNNMDIGGVVNTVVNTDVVHEITTKLTKLKDIGDLLSDKIVPILSWFNERILEVVDYIVKWLKELLGEYLVELLEEWEEALQNWIRQLGLDMGNVFKGSFKWLLRMSSIVFGFLLLYMILVYGLLSYEPSIRRTIQQFSHQFVSDS